MEVAVGLPAVTPSK